MFGHCDSNSASAQSKESTSKPQNPKTPKPRDLVYDNSSNYIGANRNWEIM